jgi:nickel transport protein
LIRRKAAVAALLLAFLAAGIAPAAALDLFARHQVTVQFATQDGKPLANAEVRVFAPGEPSRPALTGRTDSEGKFEFGADRDGFWSAEAHSGDEIARVMVRVGSGEPQKDEPLSPYWLIGGLVLLLVLAFSLRILRRRARRPR